MRRHFLADLAALGLFALVTSLAVAADTPKPKDAVEPNLKDLIVGKWQPADKAGDKVVLEFTKDGKLKIAAEGMSFDGSYKFLKDNQIEVKISIGGMEMTTKLKIAIAKDELTTKEDGKEKGDTFKRIK